jgi:hypothetical protein
MPNEWSYSDITPDRNDGNNLYFIITSISSNSFILNDCKYNLITKKIEIKKRYISTLGNSNINNFNCAFMSNSMNYTNDVLICFYIDNKNIISRTFSPENNYKEILNLKNTKNISNINSKKIYMTVKASEDRNKALVYIVLNGIPFWLTFDLINKFSDIHQINLDNFLTFENYEHSILYFKETQQFLVISRNINCELLNVIFDKHFKLKSKRINSFGNNNCSNKILFSVFFNGSDYQIINGSRLMKSFSEINLISLSNKRYIENDNLKCLTMNEESVKYNLCTSCNNANNFFEA